jgi:(S)-ureidoglycine aminohydrolase
MHDLTGHTRSVVKGRCAVLAAGGFPSSRLPGWQKAACQVLISPALGARFTQMLISLEIDGSGIGNTAAYQYFVYVLSGTAGLLLDERRHRLEPGSFAYVPPGKDMEIRSGGAGTQLLVFQKQYQALAKLEKPGFIVGHERDAKSPVATGEAEPRLQPLLPDEPQFDMSVDILTFGPGTSLARVETQYMEEGILMLRGQGVLRLGEDWHPVGEGDVIWVGPFCPKWFGTVGKSGASYICYKNVNRDPR